MWKCLQNIARNTFFCAIALTRPGPPHSQGFYITHNDAPQSVVLIWTSDQLVAETSTWQHTTLIKNIQAPRGIRTHNLSKQVAADLRLRPRGHWDQPGLLPRRRKQYEASSFRDILWQRAEIFKKNSFRTLRIWVNYVVVTGQCLGLTFHETRSLSYTA